MTSINVVIISTNIARLWLTTYKNLVYESCSGTLPRTFSRAAAAEAFEKVMDGCNRTSIVIYEKHERAKTVLKNKNELISAYQCSKYLKTRQTIV